MRSRGVGWVKVLEPRAYPLSNGRVGQEGPDEHLPK